MINISQYYRALANSKEGGQSPNQDKGSLSKNGARGGGRTLTSMGYQILNLARLPIPPPGLKGDN